MFGKKNVEPTKPEVAKPVMDLDRIKNLKVKMKADLQQIKDIIEKSQQEPTEDEMQTIKSKILDIEKVLHEVDFNFDVIFEKLETMNQLMQALADVVYPEKKQ